LKIMCTPDLSELLKPRNKIIFKFENIILIKIISFI